ncbi:hypothetical protein ACFSZT_14875 [Prauserella oleivorans]|uniref:hypothetical protein n=1 Tax=Prauserella oleivorans TaxID=1478153 RepID=UPI003606D4B0
MTAETATAMIDHTRCSDSACSRRTQRVSARKRFQKTSAPMSALPAEPAAVMRCDTSCKTSS